MVRNGRFRTTKRKPHLPSIVTAYVALAITLDVTGSTLRQKSERFTRPWPTAAMALCCVASF